MGGIGEERGGYRELGEIGLDISGKYVKINTQYSWRIEWNF
jgi:hypothetical protein